MNEYEENCSGSKKCDILIEFLKNFLGDSIKNLFQNIKFLCFFFYFNVKNYLKRFKFENRSIEAGTEKTIFKEKEANFIDNIGTLEKKNVLYEDRVFF